MRWSNVPESSPVTMARLSRFMERWKPGSTAAFLPAAAEQIAELAEPYGGTQNLPPVYLDFLRTMGESTGDLTLMFGTTSISDLLNELAAESASDSSHQYLRFSIGEVDDETGRHPDDFFDLTQRTADGADAALLRVHQEHLWEGSAQPERPFATFSDFLRVVIVHRIGLDSNDRRPVSFSLGKSVDAMERALHFLTRLDFVPTELGVSRKVMPLENGGQGAVVLLTAPPDETRSTFLWLRALDSNRERRLTELIGDHERELVG